jgi:hypothetical protein
MPGLHSLSDQSQEFPVRNVLLEKLNELFVIEGLKAVPDACLYNIAA